MSPSTRSFLLVCTGSFSGLLTMGLPLAVIPDYVHDVLGFDMIVAGFTVGAQSVATVLTRKYAGHQCDTAGGRWTTRRGLLASALAGALYLASTLVGASMPFVALGLFLGGRLAMGLAESLLLTGVFTWGVTLIGHGNSGKSLSWSGIALHAALALGAPFGIFLRGQVGYASVAAVALLTPLIGYLGTRFIRAGEAARVASLEVGFAQTVRTIWVEGAGLAFGTFGFGALSAFIAVYFRAHGWAYAAEALLLFGACYITVRVLFGSWPDRIGGVKVAACSLVVEALGQMILWRADSPGMALLGVAFTGLGFSLLFPSFGVQALRRVPPGRKGTAMGAFSAFFDVALGSTGPLCGVIIDAGGVSTIYGVGFFAALISLALVAVIARRTGTPA
jgi:predicted MFS family arabinose efflux permease